MFVLVRPDPLPPPILDEWIFMANDLPGSTHTSSAVASTDVIGDTWTWDTNRVHYQWRSHVSAVRVGHHRHRFWGAIWPLPLVTGDSIRVMVWLDATNPPNEIMLEFRDAANSWEHRAYWGDNSINLGTDGTASRWRIGNLPVTGQWVELVVPAAQVGLEGTSINGCSYGCYNGGAWWDKTFKRAVNTEYRVKVEWVTPPPATLITDEVFSVRWRTTNQGSKKLNTGSTDTQRGDNARFRTGMTVTSFPTYNAELIGRAPLRHTQGSNYEIDPGEVHETSAYCKAPSTPGTYIGRWQWYNGYSKCWQGDPMEATFTVVAREAQPAFPSTYVRSVQGGDRGVWYPSDLTYLGSFRAPATAPTSYTFRNHPTTPQALTLINRGGVKSLITQMLVDSQANADSARPVEFSIPSSLVQWNGSNATSLPRSSVLRYWTTNPAQEQWGWWIDSSAKRLWCCGKIFYEGGSTIYDMLRAYDLNDDGTMSTYGTWMPINTVSHWGAYNAWAARPPQAFLDDLGGGEKISLGCGGYTSGIAGINSAGPAMALVDRPTPGVAVTGFKSLLRYSWGQTTLPLRSGDYYYVHESPTSTPQPVGNIGYYGWNVTTMAPCTWVYWQNKWAWWMVLPLSWKWIAYDYATIYAGGRRFQFMTYNPADLIRSYNDTLTNPFMPVEIREDWTWPAVGSYSDESRVVAMCFDEDDGKLYVAHANAWQASGSQNHNPIFHVYQLPQ